MSRARRVGGGWPPRACLPLLCALLRLGRVPMELRAILPLLLALLLLLLEGGDCRRRRPGRWRLLHRQGGSTACRWHYQQAEPRGLRGALEWSLLGEDFEGGFVPVLLLGAHPSEAPTRVRTQHDLLRRDHVSLWGPTPQTASRTALPGQDGLRSCTVEDLPYIRPTPTLQLYVWNSQIGK
jgi:hypothetical protein